MNENALITKNRFVQSLYFLIPTFFILLLLLPIFLGLKVSYNILENSGAFCLYVFKIKIKYFLFEIHGRQIKLKNEKQTTEKDIEFNSPEIALLENFGKELKSKARLKFFEIYYHIGLDDAYLTSMVCGYINIILLILFTKIKDNRPTASLGVYDNISYNAKRFEVASNICISLSLFDVVYSFLNSLILSKKSKQ